LRSNALVHGGQGCLPLKTRSFPGRLRATPARAALADLLPTDAAVLAGDLSSS